LLISDLSSRIGAIKREDESQRHGGCDTICTAKGQKKDKELSELPQTVVSILVYVVS
jgi:hypothetical protein